MEGGEQGKNELADQLIESLALSYPYTPDRKSIKHRIDKAEREVYQLAEAIAFLAHVYKQRGDSEKYEFYKKWVLLFFWLLDAITKLDETI